MLTINRQSAEEELNLAESALEDLLDATPAGQPIDLTEFDGKAELERAQLTTRCQSILYARYETHRLAHSELQTRHREELASLKARQAEELSALKLKNAEEIEAIQTSNREAKFSLARHHAETRGQLASKHLVEKSEHSAKLKAARQRVKNAETVLRQLERIGR